MGEIGKLCLEHIQVSKHMNKIYLLLTICLFTVLQSCSQEYPEELKTGVFKTTTDLNTVKYMYRNENYSYIYSVTHPEGNKLAKIAWQNLGYRLEVINKTSDYDKLNNTVMLDKKVDQDSFIETTFIEGSDLKFTTLWTRIEKSPEKVLIEILKKNGIK